MNKEPAKCIRHWPHQNNGCEACHDFWFGPETNPTPQEKKAEFREYWLSADEDSAMGSYVCESEQIRRDDIHVIEYSALTESNERIKYLEASIEAKRHNNLLRGYDGMADKLDRTQAALEKAKEQRDSITRDIHNENIDNLERNAKTHIEMFNSKIDRILKGES